MATAGKSSLGYGWQVLIALGLAAGGILLVAGLLNGALVVTKQGDTTVFRYAHWLTFLVCGSGVLCFGFAGVQLLKGIPSGRALYGSVVFGILLILIGSSLGHDKVTVNRTEFTYRTGAWFNVRSSSMSFAELSRIDIISETQGAGSHSETVDYLVCYKKDGETQQFEINELMQLGAEARILQIARGRGIPVVDHTSRW